MDANKLLQHAKQLKIDNARNNLFDFISYTKPDYQMGWFNQLLCMKLDKFLKDVEEGKTPMLIVCAPPRAGKSEVVSLRFPSYILGKKPGYKIIACSYSASLAGKMSKRCKNIMKDKKYNDVFPDVHLAGSKFSDKVGKDSAKDKIDEWETVFPDGSLTGSEYIAAGVDGGITGSGFNIGIIDDPVKDYKEASSPTIQERNMDWYDTTFFTRRDPKIHGILIILTRWHPKDLAGQLLTQMAEGGDHYDLLSFPMIAEGDEYYELNGVKYHLRNKGDLLFPERMPPEFVAKAKAKSSLTWNALYQQNPTVKGGSLVKDEWWQRYRVLPELEYVKFYADTAQKAKESSDYSVFALWGKAKGLNEIYLLDIIRGKWEAPDLKKKAEDIWEKYKHFSYIHGTANNRGMAVEDKSSGTGLIQTLKKEKKVLCATPLSPGKRDKIERLNDAAPYIEAGMVKIPETASFIQDFLDEFAHFNHETIDKVKDDQIDTTMYAIEDMLIGSGAEPNIRFIGDDIEDDYDDYDDDYDFD